jgi:hypothetical protein
MQEIDPESERPSQQSATIPQSERTPIVFCSFSATPQDRRLARELERHLQALVRQGTIRLVNRFSLPIGSTISAETRRLLDEARLILLLVSADYLSDSQCYELELPRALERQQAGTAQVLMVKLRDVDLEATPLADPALMRLPSDGRPLARWRHRDAALQEIAATVRTLLTTSTAAKPGSAPSQSLPDAERLRERTAALASAPCYADIPSRERENRRAFLHMVEETWIKGVLAHSLFQETALSLGLRELPEALENPWRLVVQESERPPRPLPAGTAITEVFDESRDGTGEGASDLLLLGEPGAGKTTLLLLLLRELLRRAEQDERRPLPAYFALSTWSTWRGRGGARSRGRLVAISQRFRLRRAGASDDVREEALSQRAAEFEAWLVEELHEKYRVPVRVASDWLRAERLTLLLDGLDEVSAAARSSCLQAINAYRLLHPAVSIVLAGRREEYFAMESRAAQRRAVLITPLTDEQVAEYLVRAGPRLAGLRAALQADAELRDLAQTPLMLQVLMLTYDGLASEAVLGLSGLPTSERYRTLFTLYVERMFARRARPRFSLADTRRWLHFLALQMKRHGQTVFYMERLVANRTLEEMTEKSYRYLLAILLSVTGLAFGVIYSLITFELKLVLIDSITLGVISGLLGIVNPDTKVAEKIIWSKQVLYRKWPLIVILVIISISIIFILSITGRLDIIKTSSYFIKIIFNVSIGILVSLAVFIGLGGISEEMIDVSYFISPNSGIERSKRYSIYTLLLLSILTFVIRIESSDILTVLLLSLLTFLGSLNFGGLACIQHYLLRIILWQRNALPLRLRAFLDHACERILLRRAGGGYLFIHRLLLDYFAHL